MDASASPSPGRQRAHWAATALAVCAFTALVAVLLAALNYQVLRDKPTVALYFGGAALGCGLPLGGWMSRLLVLPCARSRRVLDWTLALTCLVCVALVFSELVQPDNQKIGTALVATATLLAALAIEAVWLLPDEAPLQSESSRGTQVTVQAAMAGGVRSRRALSSAQSKLLVRLFDSALALAVVPLVLLSIMVAGTDPAQGSWQSSILQFAYLAILIAASIGLRVYQRISPAPKQSHVASVASANDDLLPSLSAASQDSLSTTGILLARGVTRGGWDCMHGELWLFPDGLLRIPMGWGKTFLCLAIFFNPRRLRRKTFDAATFDRLIGRRRNLWIPADAIVSATLTRRQGLGGEHLRAILSDGRRVHLMWIPSHRVFFRLQPVLHAWIGDRLQVDG